MKAPQVGWPLDNAVERGYERPLIEDVTMARCFPDPNAMTRDTIQAGQAGKATFRPAGRLTALVQAAA